MIQQKVLFKMKLSRRDCITATIAAGLFAEAIAESSETTIQADELHFPAIEGFGGVYTIEGIDEPPVAGMKVLFDVTTDAEHGQVNKGLEVVARFINLAALAGVKPDQLQVAIVVHGKALLSCMNSEVYKAKAGLSANPNEKLIEKLAAAGVPVTACSQAVRRGKFSLSDLNKLVKPVTSAMVVSIDRQQQGWAVLVPH